MDYLAYFFNPAHLFTVRPNAMNTRAIIILAVIFSILIIAGVVSKVLAKTNDSLKAKGYTRFFYLFLSMGLIGYLYLFFAWQGAVLLSARFWLLILLIFALTWAGFIIKYLAKDAPKQREEINKKRQFEKYIP